MIDAVLKLQIKPPGQQQIVKTRTQQQQILQLKTGGHEAEIHIRAAVVAPHRPGAIKQRLLKSWLLLQHIQHSSAVCIRQARNHRSPTLRCIRSASC